MGTITPMLLALAPSVGIGFLFYKVMKAVLEGDRNERLAQARWEAAHSGGNPSPPPIGD
ncbi:hypothetical protein KEM60_01006 [Austwickia sp. TVS 96-490-7B]|nr:hypothetical protein [Austwickia sp. TVS 96-490-7B]